MRALLCGYYGMDNAGDEALLATLLQMLPDHVEPLVLSGNPDQTRRRYGVEAVHRFRGPEVLRALGRSDLFIFGGGSLVQDVTSWTSAAYYCGLMVTAKALGLRTLAWAQGIGPLQRRRTQALARLAFRACDQISVRDPGSLALLQSWGIPATLAPDPVWALEPLGEAPPEARGAIAVCLRPHPEFTPQRQAVVAEALDQISRDWNRPLLFLPFHGGQDLSLATTLAERLPGARLLQLTDPRALVAVFQAVEFTVAMRFHGLVMALAAHRPAYGISYDPKVTRLIEVTGCPGCELADLPTDAQSLVQQWQSARAQPIAVGDLAADVEQHRRLLLALCHQPEMKNSRGFGEG